MIVLRLLRTVLRLGLRALRMLLALAALLFVLQRSTFLPGQQWDQVAFIVSDYQFDYIGWELDALWQKTQQTLFGVQPFMTEVARAQYVRDYMAELGQVQQIEGQIDALFADPSVGDPQTASAGLRARRDSLRADLQSRQTLAEAILEGQVAAVLVEQGFGAGGQLIPPIAMRFTQVPNLLVVSPRDQIRFDISINLYALPVDRQAALEDQIDREEDVSSLIVPLGGLALYPAMILETTSIPFTLETFSHEWLHHYLFAFPLGYNYFIGDAFAGEARIINETTADLFGKELGRLVLGRYYPDLVPPPPPPVDANVPQTTRPPAFDYGAEMNTTRVTVDGLLGEGKIDEAEAYMERRRRLFVANGYRIRKLNQAYFVFYGGYQSATPGAAGEDPIGPAVHAIREASPSLLDFVVTMRGITTRDQLLSERDSLLVEQGGG